MKAPCLNCEDRTITCHSECEKYKDYTKQLAAYKEKEKANLLDGYIFDAINQMKTSRSTN